MPLWSQDTYDVIIRENDRMCVGCNKFKLWEEFHRSSSGLNGHDSRCKTCRSRERKEKYLTNLEYREKKLEAGRVWVGQKPEVMKRLQNRALLRLYSLTPESFNELITKQDGKCMICNATLTSANWSVDHEHLLGESLKGIKGKRGPVRGILCKSCNSGLGYFKDNIELLKAAIYYLESGKETQVG